jgi:anti-sigma B factor antagonist
VRQLHLTTQQHDGYAVVRLTGELDLASVDDLRLHLRTTREKYGDHIILDLTDLEFMDSQGLSAIIDCHKTVTAASGRLALVAPRPIVRRTLEITGLTRRLDIVDTIDDLSAPGAKAAT